MAYKKNNTDCTKLLLQCVTNPKPMPSMLESLCVQAIQNKVHARSNILRLCSKRAGWYTPLNCPERELRLVTTYLMEYAEDWSVSRAYLSQESIEATLQTAA